MPKIISAQEAKNLFLSEDLPRKGYFVVEMKSRSNAQVLELEEHMKKLKKKRVVLDKDKKNKPESNLSKKIKNKLQELIF